MSDFTDVSKVDPDVLRRAQKLMDKDKYNLITEAEHTFIMNIMFSMRFAWTTKTWAGATDGVYIYTNPENYVKQDQPFRQFLLLHETYHVVFKHVCRGKAMPHLDQERMNAAEDFMINLLIKDQLGWVPQEALCDEKYRGMSSMEIYHLLPTQPQNPMGGDVLQLGEGEGNIIQNPLIQGNVGEEGGDHLENYDMDDEHYEDQMAEFDEEQEMVFRE